MWMGIIGLPEMRMYWARNMTFSLSAFPQTMSRRRFEAIHKYFHSFNRRAVPKGNPDKLMIIRPVLEFILEKCRTLYIPTTTLSIDEGMLKWKGRLSIRVYNPMKPIKYGIKFYFLCETRTGYVLDCIIYRWVTSTLRDIVFNLLGRHLGKGYQVFMDNYYNSVSLAEELYENKTHVSGTLRLPRGAPNSLKNMAKSKSLNRGEMAFRRKGNTLVLIWQDIRLVSCVTTASDASTEDFTHRRRVKRAGKFVYEEVTMQRPKLIRDYVNFMGGVDLFDQMINYYAIARRTYKWTKKTIFYLIQLGLLNGYNLYRLYGPPGKKLKLRDFQQVIADHLLYFDEREWPDSGNRLPHAPSLPANERYDTLPPADPTRPSATPGPVYGRHPVSSTPVPASAPPHPSIATPASSSATPGPSSATPGPSSPTPSEAEDDPGIPQAAPASTHKSHTIVDHPDRLDRSYAHEIERIGAKRQQRRCRVCQQQGIRRDTVFQCTHCKIALCHPSQRDCFKIYHTVRRYWAVTPTPGTGTHARRGVTRRQ